MANYPVAAGSIAAHDKVLVANTPDTITFADDIESIDVLTDGSAAVYVRVDQGGAAAVSGAFSRKIPAQAGVPQSRHIGVPSVGTGAGTIISIISAGTPTYSVMSGGARGRFNA